MNLYLWVFVLQKPTRTYKKKERMVSKLFVIIINKKKLKIHTYESLSLGFRSSEAHLNRAPKYTDWNLIVIFDVISTKFTRTPLTYNKGHRNSKVKSLRKKF
jgi:hypothetical protein